MPHLREIPAGMLDDSDHNVRRISCIHILTTSEYLEHAPIHTPKCCDHKGTATTAIPNAWDLTKAFFSFLFFSFLFKAYNRTLMPNINSRHMHGVA